MSADPEVTREMEPPTYTVLGETLAHNPDEPIAGVPDASLPGQFDMTLDSGVNAIWRAEARGREAGFKSARMRDEQLRQSMWRSVLWTSAQECAS